MKEKNVDTYDINAIEKKMQKMSATTANRLGTPEKKTSKKTTKKKDA